MFQSRSLSAFTLLMAVGVSSIALTNALAKPQITTYTTAAGATPRPFWPWAQQEWTRPDTDFVRIRKEADAFLKSTSARSDRKDIVLAKLRQLIQEAQRDPRNSQSLFRWAYTTHEARKLDIRPDANGRDIYEMYGTLESARPQGSYQYDRMIYIIYSCINESKRNKPLAKRLLRRDPADIEVKYFLTRILSTGTTEEQALALTYARQFQRQHPERPRSQSLLGFVYSIRWWRDHKLVDVDKSIAAYRKYLSMIPATNSSHHDIEHLVQVLERDKAQHAR